MLHWDYVGHFDPSDPLDTSEKPYKPKVVRPITKEAVERALASFGRDVEKFVFYYPEGYILCNWSNAPWELGDRVRRFAVLLAEIESAVVMDEEHVVEHPPEAREAQQDSWAARRA